MNLQDRNVAHHWLQKIRDIIGRNHRREAGKGVKARQSLSPADPVVQQGRFRRPGIGCRRHLRARRRFTGSDGPSERCLVIRLHSLARFTTTRLLLRAEQGRFRLNRFVPSDRMLIKAIAGYLHNVDGLPLCATGVFQSAPSFLTIKTASFAFRYRGQGQCCKIRRRIHMRS